MNPDGKIFRIDDPGSTSDDSSDAPYGSSSTMDHPPAGTSTSVSSRPATSSHSLDTRRNLAKEMIERYFYQLQRGCGNPKCTNSNCASSGKVPSMNPNEIAAKALQLFSQDAKLCERYNSFSNNSEYTTSENQNQQGSPKMSRVQNSSSHSPQATVSRASSSDLPSPNNESSTNSLSTSSSTTSSYTNSDKITTITSKSSSTDDTTKDSLVTQNQAVSNSESSKKIASSLTRAEETVAASEANTKINVTELTHIDESVIDSLLAECETKESNSNLLVRVAEVFSSIEKLSQSFRISASKQLVDSKSNNKLHKILSKSPSDLKKEDLRTLEGEIDKDEDSTCLHDQVRTISLNVAAATLANSPNSSNLISLSDNDASHLGTDSYCDTTIEIDSVDSDHASDGKNIRSVKLTVDLHSLRQVKRKLASIDISLFGDSLNNNIELLANSIENRYQHISHEKIIHCLVICFDMATDVSDKFNEFEFLERCLPKLCDVTSSLPVMIQADLARTWAQHCPDRLKMMVLCFQQLISVQSVLLEEAVQYSPDIIAITKVMKIVYYANILTGESDPLKDVETTTHDEPSSSQIDANSADSGSHLELSSGNYSDSFLRALQVDLSDDDNDEIFFVPTVTNNKYPKFAVDRLAIDLNINVLECYIPIVPFEEFYNEPLSECVRMEKDYMSFRSLSLDPRGEKSHFSFMLYAFILTPAAKYNGLYFDNRIRMYSERDRTLMALLDDSDDGGSDLESSPDLRLKVRREHIVHDALIGLEMIAINTPKTLKKQLAVEFVGEEGIDEGGVSKEFFQLIVEEIFNVDYGMFVEQKETNLIWFNSSSFEIEAQYTLIGIIIGLAIYNSVVLPLRFPMVVYRKLMGGKGTLHDLKDWNPTLYNSLKSLLEYEEDDIESTFMLTFKINYENVFGEVMDYELKPDGDNILVNQSNKREYVKLYVDYLLNSSIERQFKAFKKGFDMVTYESPLKLLFRPEEIEVLVCGSKIFDFMELEKSTQYDGGYTKDSSIIKDFWSIVHAMPEESKRKLVEFTTGSDRVPVGGLSRLRLVITRHGPDSDRLPTSHTCFNILLLPEYSSKEKLEERLIKAINYSKGFGML